MKFVILLSILVQTPLRRVKSFEDIPKAYDMHFQDFLQALMYLLLD